MMSKPALQKAATEWKMPNQSPSQKPRSGMNLMHNSRAPTPSKNRVPQPMVPVISVMRPMPLELIEAAITPRSCMLMRRFTSFENSVAMVIKPRPPIWMSTSTTTWPKKDQWVPVSTITRPVTHEALVDVKRAGIKPVTSPDAEETGSIKSNVPIIMTRKKPRAIVCTDVSCLRFIHTRAISLARRPKALRTLYHRCRNLQSAA